MPERAAENRHYYAEKNSAKDNNARAERHFGLVHACCKRFSGKGIEYDELFSAGCLGLAKALNNFDESRGLQFSTYAFPVIMGEVKRLFRDGGTVRVSRSLRELGMKIEKLNNENRLKHGCDLSLSQLAQALGTTPEQIAEAINASRQPVSLDGGDDEEDGGTDVPIPDIQEEITERLTLRQALTMLPEKERSLIILRYYRCKTQTQTAAELDMTQVQVSRLEKKILQKLRGIV